MTKLEIRNDSLDLLNSMLLKVSLKGTASRMRARFLNELSKHLEVLKQEHLQLVKDYSYLDEKGNPVIEGENYKIKEEFIEDFNKSFSELYSESFDMEVNKENKKMLEYVLKALDEVEDLSGDLAIIHFYVYERIEEALK